MPFGPNQRTNQVTNRQKKKKKKKRALETYSNAPIHVVHSQKKKMVTQLRTSKSKKTD